MVLATKPNTHAPFIQALKNMDPILADAFITVQEQTSSTRSWQYIWAGYQQEQGTITPGREADKVFQAFTLTHPDIHGTSEDSPNKVATAITNPYHRMLDDYEDSERRWIDEMSFRLADDEPSFTAQQRRSLDELLQTLRNNIAYAEALVTRGLNLHNQDVYAQGISVLERVYDAV